MKHMGCQLIEKRRIKKKSYMGFGDRYQDEGAIQMDIVKDEVVTKNQKSGVLGDEAIAKGRANNIVANILECESPRRQPHYSWP